MLLKNCPSCKAAAPRRFVLTGPHEGVLAEYLVDLHAPVEVCECHRCGLTLPITAWQNDDIAGRLTRIECAA